VSIRLPRHFIPAQLKERSGKLKSDGGWTKMAKNGAVWDKFGVFLDNFGIIWAQFGIVLAYFGNKKTPKNRILGTKNAESTQFPRLIPLKKPGL
jgi:hypothetical protein